MTTLKGCRQAVVLVAVLSMIASSNCFAERKKPRSEYPFGVYLSANGDPAPGGLGLNLSVTLLGFLRFNLGASGYQDGMETNLPIGLYNFTIRPLLYFFAYLGNFLASNGRSRLDYDSFLNIPYKETHSSAVTYGGGIKLVVADWKLSPALGVNVSQWQGTGSPWGSDSGTIVYGNLGLDYQNGHTYAAFGYNFCPTPASCGFYLNFGRFF